MRKIMYILPPVALVLCLVLVLIMTGVWQIPSLSPAPSTSQSIDAGSTAPSTSIPEETSGGEYVRQNMISISLPEMTNTVVSEDGTVLFRHTFQDISLISPNPGVNETVTLDLLQRMDINISTVVMLEDMTQYYTPGTAWNTLYYEFIYSPTRIDNTVLSLKGAESIYAGSGQANNSIICVNYYLPTGHVMTLGDVLSEESTAQDALMQALLRVLAHNATQWNLFEDYSEPVILYFSSYLQQESNWFFSPEGLNICFAPYEIAPQSSGTVVATIPVGYADGLDRHLSRGKGIFSVNGHRVPTIGNICMDMTMLDVTGVDVKVGDTVTIFGDSPTVSEIAEALGTIPYEILTSVPRRIERVIIK